MHDCRKDVVALLDYDVSCAPVLDSQLVYALSSGRARNVSLSDCLKEFIGHGHPLKKDAPHTTDKQFWAKRPISDLGLAYAALDVQLLHDAVLTPLFQKTLRSDFEGIRLATDARIVDELHAVGKGKDDEEIVESEVPEVSVFRSYAECTSVRFKTLPSKWTQSLIFSWRLFHHTYRICSSAWYRIRCKTSWTW